MAKPLWVVVGVLLIVMGSVWALQGWGVIGGSAMSGTTTWSIIGPLVVIAGAALVWSGARRKG